MTHSTHPVPYRTPEHPDTRRSWYALAALPFELVLGFVLGSLLVGDPNDAASPQGWDAAWRVVLLWAALVVPPALGMRWAWHAWHEGDRSARLAGVLNGLVFLFFTAATLVGGLSDAFD